MMTRQFFVLLFALGFSVPMHAESLRQHDLQELSRLRSDIARHQALPRELGPPELGNQELHLLSEYLMKATKVNGPDNRIDAGFFLKEITSLQPRDPGYFPDRAVLRSNITAVAAMVPRDWMELRDGIWRPKSLETYQSIYGVCDTVEYAHQPVLSKCTAFLVAPGVLATAYHCCKGYPQDYLFVFGFTSEGENASLEFPQSAVLAGCAWGASEEREDWALIEVEGTAPAAPLVIDWDQEAEVGDPIYMIGHPAGLPLKVTDDASVLHRAFDSFTTDLDSLSGNSGSPVFCLTSGEVVGILKNSDDGYIHTGNCKVIDPCPKDLTGCKGEGATQITALKCSGLRKAIPASR